MTKEDAILFKERWQIVNRVISEEIRNTPPDLKTKQIGAAFQTAKNMGLTPSEEPFKRWQMLKEKLKTAR